MTLTEVAQAAQDSAYGLLIAFVALAIWAFYTGKVHSDREFSKLEKENDELRSALDAERQINAEMARAGTVTNQLIGALTEVARERHAADQVPEMRPGLTAEDLGL